MTEENSVEAAWDDSFSGFFEAAGVDVATVSDDPYNFGKDYHMVAIKEWRVAKVSPLGKYGSYLFFEIVEDKYENVRPFGFWLQLPPPEAVQAETGIKFDAENDAADNLVAFNLKRLIFALGYNIDEMNKFHPRNASGKPFLARLYAKLNEESGYWEIRMNQPTIRRMPSEDTPEYEAVMARAAGEKAEKSSASNDGGVNSAEAALLAAMEQQEKSDEVASS